MPRTVEPLTDTKIRNAKPREKAYKLFDGGGLYLEVMTDGRKLWRFKYTRPSGAENRLGFGTYPTVGLAQARGQRDNARAAVAAGEDPGALKIEARRAAKIAVGNSFEAVARDWHSTQKEAWTPTYASKIIVSLENDVFPLIGSKPINQIKAPEILDLLRIIEARGVRDTTKRVLQRMRAVFQYGIVFGACDRNPAADIDSAAALKTVPVKHMARVSAAELPQLLRDIDQDQHGEAVTKLALQFMTLTFPRTKEMILAKWDEFDVSKAEWRIPASRMKTRNQHIVPLSRQALAVLEKLREFNGHREDVFYSAQAKGPISNNTMLFALYRLGYRGRMTGHGFRGLASTTLNEMGFRADVVERQLAHVERNKVRAAYNHAQYLPERREMMQAWGDYIESLRTA